MKGFLVIFVYVPVEFKRFQLCEIDKSCNMGLMLLHIADFVLCFFVHLLFLFCTSLNQEMKQDKTTWFAFTRFSPFKALEV